MEPAPCRGMRPNLDRLLEDAARSADVTAEMRLERALAAERREVKERLSNGSKPRRTHD